MKAIYDKSEFDLIEVAFDKVIDRTKTIPEQVFRQALKSYLFIPFDDILLTERLFKHLKEYLINNNEKILWLTVGDPDPVTYFAHHFGFFGTVEFSVTDKADDYLSALWNFPQESEPDALMHNSNTLMLTSPSGKWAIVGDRYGEIAVCAFSDKIEVEKFRKEYGSDMFLNNVSEATEFTEYSSLLEYDSDLVTS
jgi:hypothetical protein